MSHNLAVTETILIFLYETKLHITLKTSRTVDRNSTISIKVIKKCQKLLWALENLFSFNMIWLRIYTSFLSVFYDEKSLFKRDVWLP